MIKDKSIKERQNAIEKLLAYKTTVYIDDIVTAIENEFNFEVIELLSSNVPNDLNRAFTSKGNMHNLLTLSVFNERPELVKYFLNQGVETTFSTKHKNSMEFALDIASNKKFIESSSFC